MEGRRKSFTQNTLKDIGISFLPYLYRLSDFLKGSVNKAISEVFCGMSNTIPRGFSGEAFPFLRIGIVTSLKDQKTAELPMRKEMRENQESRVEGQMGRDDAYPTSGRIKPRPSTINEASQSSGAYARLPQE